MMMCSLLDYHPPGARTRGLMREPQPIRPRDDGAISSTAG